MTSGNTPVALVTGGAGGIGAAIAARLIGQGASVALVDIRADAVKRTAATMGAHPYAVDISDPDSVAALRARIEGDLGPVDWLVANAGLVVPEAPTWAQPSDVWRRAFGVMLDGPRIGITEFVPGMVDRGHGRVVIVASIGGLMPLAGFAPYAAAKAGAIALGRTLATEFETVGGDLGAAVVAPGLVRTDIGANSKSLLGRTAGGATEYFGKGLPPDEVAANVIAAIDHPGGVTVVQAEPSQQLNDAIAELNASVHSS